MRKQKTSLIKDFLMIIVTCWLVPLVIVVALAGLLLGRSYEKSAQQKLDVSAQYAVHHIQMHLDEAIYDSKSASYEGIIGSAYREYQQSGDSVSLYREVEAYLNRNYARAQQYKAVFVCFLDKMVNADVYLTNSSITGYELLQECQQNSPQILDAMKDADTNIRFILLDGNLYLARNLLNTHFETYATVVMMLDPMAIFGPLDALSQISGTQMCLDDTAFYIDDQGNLEMSEECCMKNGDVHYTVEKDGHSFAVSANIPEYHVLRENPWLYVAIVLLALMVLPLLIFVILLFRKHVTQPMATLAAAHRQVEAGNRGYEIAETAPNEEFDQMYGKFNEMSKELKNQFDRSYLEQQAAQKAQIKALQSQINPHFLNNTLEIINWEARLADNTRISAMIEALSTMLGAALDRKGRTQIPLSEELGYVDAYLYIIQERLGEGFRVYKQIDADTLSQTVPRLILQPIVENAVEHDITARHGGSLWVRAYLREHDMVLEVEHDGTMTQEDRENINELLSDQTGKNCVGIHNVYQRLKLIYGSQGALRIEETAKGTILARICFPADFAQSEGGKTE